MARFPLDWTVGRDALERTMAMLFEVTIARTAYVLAETAEEAKEMQREIERWEDFPSVEAEPWTGGTLPGWDDKCLVYHGGKGDISLAVAKQMVTPNGVFSGAPTGASAGKHG